MVHPYAVTKGQQRFGKDQKLAIVRAEAKYDLTRFVEDFDLANRQIQEAKARLVKAAADNKRITKGAVSHPAVRFGEEASTALHKVRLITGAVEGGKEP
jgi:hypothetical protein